VLPRARYIFIGKAEAETVLGLQGDPEEVLNDLARRNAKATIVLLQGGDGSTVLDSGRLWRPTVRHAVQMIDPIGAGDAYAAGFLWASLNGKHPQDAVNIAAAVAALKCSMWGDFALINPKEIEDALGGGADVRR
jgi:2-dehydro-3-deoxygluconokinase